jgi:hypothetical protein
MFLVLGLEGLRCGEVSDLWGDVASVQCMLDAATCTFIYFFFYS